MTLSEKKEDLSKNSRPKQKKKEVRFAPLLSKVMGTVPSEDSESEGEESHHHQDRLYLQHAEYRTFKLLATLDARSIALHSRGSVEVIDAVFKSVACLTDILEEDELEDFAKDPSKHARSLDVSWNQRTAGRGLEKWVSEIHGLDRYENAKDSRRTVVDAHNSVGEEELAFLYREKSRFSALYARVVGEADAVTAMALHHLHHHQKKDASSSPSPSSTAVHTSRCSSPPNKIAPATTPRYNLYPTRPASCGVSRL